MRATRLSILTPLLSLVASCSWMSGRDGMSGASEKPKTAAHASSNRLADPMGDLPRLSEIPTMPSNEEGPSILTEHGIDTMPATTPATPRAIAEVMPNHEAIWVGEGAARRVEVRRAGTPEMWVHPDDNGRIARVDIASATFAAVAENLAVGGRVGDLAALGSWSCQVASGDVVCGVPDVPWMRWITHAGDGAHLPPIAELREARIDRLMWINTKAPAEPGDGVADAEGTADDHLDTE